MKHILESARNEAVVCLGDSITYGMRKEWGSATWRPLKLSLMCSRQHWKYDPRGRLPLLLFICGGGFTHVDANVWMPELAYYAKRGYAVASIEYSTTGGTVFPAQVEDIREGIRFLQAHADEFRLDMSRCAIMGESAGAYLAGCIAFIDGAGQSGVFTAPACKTGVNSAGSAQAVPTYAHAAEAALKAAILLYPPVALDKLPANPIIDTIMKGAPDLASLVTPSAPPIFLAHGTNDNLVPCSQSEYLYDALEKNHVKNEFYLIKDCDHADSPVFQSSVKELICQFLAENVR